MHPQYPGNQQPALPYANVAAHRAAWWLGAEPVQPELINGDPRLDAAYRAAANDYYQANARGYQAPIGGARFDFGPHPAQPFAFPGPADQHFVHVPRGPVGPHAGHPGIDFGQVRRILSIANETHRGRQRAPVPNFDHDVPARPATPRMVPRARPVPLGDVLMDRAIAGQPLGQLLPDMCPFLPDASPVVWMIDVYFPVLRNNVTLREHLVLPSDRDPVSFREEICRKMQLNAGAANLGFKTSRDKVKDAPRPFDTPQDVTEAINSVSLAKSRARKHPVHLEIINLVRGLPFSHMPC